MATDRLYRFAIVGLAIACSMFHFCFFVVQLRLCNPIAKQWGPTIIGGTCIPTMPLYTAMAVIAIIFEVLMCVPPFHQDNPLTNHQTPHPTPHHPLLGLHPSEEPSRRRNLRPLHFRLLNPNYSAPLYHQPVLNNRHLSSPHLVRG